MWVGTDKYMVLAHTYKTDTSIFADGMDRMKRVGDADGALVGQISGTFNLASNQYKIKCVPTEFPLEILPHPRPPHSNPLHLIAAHRSPSQAIAAHP